MTGNLHVLATRYAGRPQLILPRAAEDLVRRLGAIDERAGRIAGTARPGVLQRLARLISDTGRGPAMAMEDDDDGPPPVPFEQRAAYAPLYVSGEVEDFGYCWALSQGVALMQCDTVLLDRGEDFCGTVYHGYDTLLQAMCESSADERVKAIFLRECSPGGVVAGGLPALAARMREIRAAAGGKPIWVYADMACSAAYWIAAQADRIVAPAQGLVGSIGAVLVHEDWSAALDKAGVKVEAIQFGAQKTAGAWWDALSDAARADLQAEIDQCGRDFVADLVLGRPSVTAEAALATEARVYMGRHDEPGRSALDLKLVDAIMSEQDAFAELVEAVSRPSATLSAPLGTTSAAAQGARGASPPQKEPAMAVKGPKTGAAATLAALVAQKATLDAEIARMSAAKPDPDEADEADEAEDAMDGGADEAAEGEADETEEQDNKKAPEAAAIAASAEAKAHPALALAAIGSGQTLAMFQASVAALPAASTGRLAGHMAAHTPPRLGPDGAAQPSAAAQLDPVQVYARRRGGARRSA